MHWIAPSERDADTAALEKRLWDAAEQAVPASHVAKAEFVIRNFHRLSIHGVEKTDETGRLCRLNLAVHGLEGEIKHGGNINSYYDEPSTTWCVIRVLIPLPFRNGTRPCNVLKTQ